MTQKYNFREIEKKWQSRWLSEKVFKASDRPKNKYYQLETFPYPSAAGLHVGHPKGYIAEDVHARYMRMHGYEVLYTMGWDAFGLPTENYAIKIGKSPHEVAEANIRNFKRQVQMFGLSYDWDREINTSSPEYYKWTQWLFIKLWEKGLAYRKRALVNWCPKDLTVLANEQVVEGCCERCGSKIEQREMEQWFFRITDYAERLLADLDQLDPATNEQVRSSGAGWPEASIKRQKDWIGRSEGAELDFEVKTAEPPNFVLIHGFASGPERHFFPWLRKELEKRGYKVQVPALPNPKEPNIEEQIRYVFENTDFDKDTVVLGHSLGSVVAMKAVERRGAPIRKLVLAAGFSRPPSRREKPQKREYEPTFDWKFDFKKIKQLSGEVVVLRDTKDNIVPRKDAEILYEKLGGQFVEFAANEEHICAEREPEVLRNVLDTITVFTTRPDTLYGATYVVLAPEHHLISTLKSQISNWKEVEEYVELAKHKTELQRKEEARTKTGVELKGVKAINPATQEEIPVWVADYVLASVGTGAIMAVPSHDVRDWEFAEKYGLPKRLVVMPRSRKPETLNSKSETNSKSKIKNSNKEVYEGEGTLVNSAKFTGMDSEKAKWEITKFVNGRRKVQYRLRDWSVSRQRYWGVPIPIIYCRKCWEESRVGSREPDLRYGLDYTTIDGENYMIHPVPEKDLPVKLPPLKDYRPKGGPPLASSEEFMRVKCPKCGGEARRDPETLDTFVDSSWYFLRYTDPQNAEEPFDKKKAAHWLPVDLYVIGAEHTTAHLLYARFITKFLHDAGYLGFSEPFLKLRHQGLILGEDGQKMSKRYGNVVNPDDIIEKFGADTLRLYEMFMGPFEDAQPWSSHGVLGMHRFLNRVWSVISNFKSQILNLKSQESQTSNWKEETGGVVRLLHKTIKKVGEDIKDLKFNTAISALMILLNEFEKNPPLSVTSYELFVKLLHPFAPHIAQELWSQLGHDTYLDFEKWPEYDEKLIREEKITLIVQVNGKVRDSFEADANIGEEEAKKMALRSEKVRKYLGDKEPKKVIYVKGKLINVVV